jgi:tRNA-splicing ligase RtcB
LLRGGGAGEAPGCDTRLSEVLAFDGDTIRALHTVRPIGVAMVGRERSIPIRD